MDNELQKKMDTYNEMLLENAAMTFTAEGISNDLKDFLSKKSIFVGEMLNGLASLIGAASTSRVSASRQKLFDDMMKHALIEVKTLNSTLNYVLSRVLDKEASLMPPAPPQKPKKTTRVKGKDSKNK